MARAGRKRKIGVAREASGKVARVYVNPKQQVMDQPHRVVTLAKYRETQEAGTEFGRLMLSGGVTPAQHEAGIRYAELAAQYRSALLCPSPNPAAMDLGRVGKGKGAGMADETALALQTRYDRAYESCGPQRLQVALREFVIMDNPVSNALSLDLLTCGLDKLVSHFGIDKSMQITDRPK